MAETLAFHVEVDTDQGVARLRLLRQEFEKLDGTARKTGPPIAATGTSAATAALSFGGAAAKAALLGGAFVAVAAAARRFVSAFDEVLEAGAKMEELSRRFATPVEQLERLRFAGAQAGVSIEELAPTFRAITTALKEAGQEGSEARQIFENLGLADELERLKRLSPVERLLAIGSAFQRYADDANKAAHAQVVLGKSSDAALQLFRDPDLAENLSRQSQLTEAFAERADRLDDALTRLDFAWNDFKISLANAGFLDALTSAIEGLTSALEDQESQLQRMARIGTNWLLGGIPLALIRERERAVAQNAATETALNTPLSAHDTGPATVTGLRRFIDSTKDALPNVVKPGDSKAVDTFLQKLELLRQEVTAGLDPVAKFRAEVQRQAAAMLGGAKATDEQRETLEGLVAANLRTDALAKFGETIQDLAADLIAVRDPSEAAAFATRALAEDLEKNLGISLDGILSKLPLLPPEVAAVQSAFAQLDQAVRQGLPQAELEARLATLVETAQTLERVTQQDRGAGLFSSYERELRVFHGEITDSQAAVEELTESLKLAGAQQGPRGELLEDYARSVITAREELEGFFDVFDALGEGWNRFLTSVGEGTLLWEEIGQSIKASLLRNFSEAFAGAWKEKLGFEGAFKVNLVQFLGNVGGIIRGGTGGQGLVGALFQGVVGGNGESLLSSAGRALGLGGAVPSFGAVNLPSTFVGPPQLLPSTFVGPPGPGQATLAGQSGGLLGNLAGLAAAVGAIYSLAKTIQGLGETFKAFKAVTFDDKSANQNFRAVSTMGLVGGAVGGAAAGAGIGAATGFLGGGPIGLVVGALVGAAVGAALSKAISDSVAKAVGGSVSEQVKRGGTQADLDKSIKDSLSGNLILNILSGFSNTILSQLIGGLLAPNIETIFDKLFASVLQKLEFPVNRQLGERGQGVPAHVRQVTVAPTGERTVTRISGRDELRQLAPLRGDAGILATILAGQIGAGTENAERIERFTNILINSLARLGKTFDQAEAVIFRTLRNAAAGRFTTALDLVDQTFPVPSERREERLAERAAAARDRQQDRLADRLERQQDRAEQRREKAQERFDKATGLAVRSFEPILPGVDLAKFAEFFQEDTFGKRALKTSRTVTREAFPELFGKESFEEGVGDFQASLAGAVRQAFEEGIGKAVLKPLLDQIFAPVFAEINEGAKRLKRQGFTPENIERFTSDVQQRVTESVQLLADPGLQSILEQLVEADRKLTEALRENQIQLAIANGRRVEAVSLALQALPPVGAGDDDAQIRQLILDRLEPLRQAVENFAALAEAARDFAENLRLRSLPFINGELGTQAQRTRERERAFERADTAGVGFGPGGFTLDLEKVNRDPETAFARFQDAANLYVDELVAGIEAGRRATALKSNVRISTALALGRGPGADQARVDAFRSARQDAGTRLAGAGITFGEDGGLSIDMTQVSKDVAFAESLLEEYGRLRLEEMQTELEALKAQKAFAEQVHRFFVGPGGILSQIDVLRSGKRGQERTLEQLHAENVALRPAALAGDEDAIRKLQENYGQGLALAQSLYAPGSAEFSHWLDVFEAGAKEFGAAFELDPELDSKIAVLEGAIVIFGDNMIAAATAIEDATKDLPATLETFVSAAEAVALQFEGIFLAKRDEAQLALQAEFTRIVTALEPLGIANDILRDIATDLGLFLDKVSQPPVVIEPPAGPGDPGGPPPPGLPDTSGRLPTPDHPGFPGLPTDIPPPDTGVIVNPNPTGPQPPGHFVRPPGAVIPNPAGPREQALGPWKAPWQENVHDWFAFEEGQRFEARRPGKRAGFSQATTPERWRKIAEHFHVFVGAAALPVAHPVVARPPGTITSGGGPAPTIGAGAGATLAATSTSAVAATAVTPAVTMSGGSVAATRTPALEPWLAPSTVRSPFLPTTALDSLQTLPTASTTALSPVRVDLDAGRPHPLPTEADGSFVPGVQALTDLDTSLEKYATSLAAGIDVDGLEPLIQQIARARTELELLGAVPGLDLTGYLRGFEALQADLEHFAAQLSAIGGAGAEGLVEIQRALEHLGATVAETRQRFTDLLSTLQDTRAQQLSAATGATPAVTIPGSVAAAIPSTTIAQTVPQPAIHRATVLDLGAFREAREAIAMPERSQAPRPIARFAAAAGLALAVLGAGPSVARATRTPAVLSSVHDTLRTPGTPLPGTIRRDMEARFGRSFGAVRLHTDTQAARSASAIQALAYTVGPHIAFAAGRFRPETPEGQALLAHELAHVVQQGPTSPLARLTVGAADSPIEREADQMAAVALRADEDWDGVPEPHDVARRMVLHRASTVQQQSVPLAGLQVVAPDSTTTGGASARPVSQAPTKREQNIEVTFNNEFHIDGQQTPEETARQVSDALRKRTLPSLVAEVRRAAGT